MRAKLLVSLVLAATASSVFAMPYEPAKHPAILEVALTGGGFKIDGSNTDFGINATSRAATGVASGDVLQNDPKYKFGGAVELGYYFCDSTINVDASWTAARARRSDSASGDVTALLIPPDVLGANRATSAESDFHFDFDLINLEVGSLTRVNQNGLILNPKLGLTYARLKGDQTVVYGGGTLGAALDPASVLQETDFRGFGPSVGLDLNFVVCNPINLTGNIRYSALVGDINSTNYVSAGTTGVVNTVGFGTKNAIVSVIQSELALGYDFNWSDMFCGNIAIGYQLTKAIDASQSLYFVDDVADSMFVNELFNKSIHGYFARLTMDFEV